MERRQRLRVGDRHRRNCMMPRRWPSKAGEAGPGDRRPLWPRRAFPLSRRNGSSLAPGAWSGRSGYASSAALRPPSLRATEQGRPPVGPLAVRQKPRQRYATAGRPLGSRTLRRHGSCRPRGGSHHHPPALPPTCLSSPAARASGLRFNALSLRVGGSNRRCRGWQISPEPAGTGRASRVGETAAPLHANAKGPRCGSRPPVASGGVCGRSGWGDARPHPATHGTGKKAVTQ